MPTDIRVNTSIYLPHCYLEALDFLTKWEVLRSRGKQKKEQSRSAKVIDMMEWCFMIEYDQLDNEARKRFEALFEPHLLQSLLALHKETLSHYGS